MGDFDFTKDDVDMLREISNIGAGNAATSLSRLLNCRVDLRVPQTRIVEIPEFVKVFLGGVREPFCFLSAKTGGDISGELCFILNPEESRKIGKALLGRNLNEVNPSEDLFKSSLLEIVNILAGNFCNALAEMTNLTIVHSPPEYKFETPRHILEYFQDFNSREKTKTLYFETIWVIDDLDVESVLIYLPDKQSLNLIVDKLRK